MLSHGETVFMQTAQVEIQNPKSSASVTERILLDCGSQRTYISQSLVNKLGLKKQHVEELRVFTFGGKEAKVIKTHVTTIKLKLKNGQLMCLDANIVPVISGNIQRKSLNEEIMDNFKYLADRLDLADTFPAKSETSEIELLIGNDYYLDLVLQQRIEIYPGLYLLCSRLGWVLTGRSKTDINDNNIPSMLVLTHGSTYMNKSEVCGIDNPVKPLHDLEDFWNIRAICIHDKDKNSDDELSRKMFEETLTFENGRYNVTWPWKEKIPDLPQNKELAFGHLRSCLKRLKNKPEMLKKYDYVIKDQQCKGVIEKVKDPNDKNHMCHYLPHHAVITPHKSTTKLRIVYDASAKVSKEAKNLNENLCRGPVLLKDLFGLLMRFRLYNVAMVADIEKAFLQVGLQESERDVTRFFWVKDTKNASVSPDNIDIYRFCRVPFGIIASPFLLSATIEAHLKLYDTDLAKKLKSDIYVDNIISGGNSDEEAMVLYTGAKCVFKDASMNLREWISNSEKVNSFIPEVDRSSESQPQVLGHIWDHKADTLSEDRSEKCSVCVRPHGAIFTFDTPRKSITPDVMGKRPRLGHYDHGRNNT